MKNLMLSVGAHDGFQSRWGKTLHFQTTRRPPRSPERGLARDPCTNMAPNIRSTRSTEKNHGNEKRLLRAGPTNEVEVKRLKLMFLLMMSLGPYRTPVH